MASLAVNGLKLKIGETLTYIIINLVIQIMIFYVTITV